MSLYESFLRPLAFQVDPETVHERAMWALSRGFLQAPAFHDPKLEQTLFGVKFPNPLGLAAGFDKNALAVNFWHKLGFGFVEVGTVTFHPQPGNPKPRLFRLPEEKGLINRLGFNNDGAQVVAGRLAESKPKIPVGINLGKSKITPLEEAAKDYAESFRLLRPFGDYFVVNVSSPNTPGLRELQGKDHLLAIFNQLREVDSTKPMFVKVAPDLAEPALDEVVEVALAMKLTGIVATNTTIRRDMLATNPQQEGGLSGRPVQAVSDQTLAYLKKQVGDDLILIGVGGIFDGKDLKRKLDLGAKLAQVYTGWIYGGPRMVPQALQALALATSSAPDR